MTDMKDNLLGKVQADMDVFKKILDKVPGFKGYIDRQARRDSDKLLRDTVFRRFRDLEGRVSEVQREFIGHGELMYVDDLEAAAVRLRTFADTRPDSPARLFKLIRSGQDQRGRAAKIIRVRRCPVRTGRHCRPGD